MIDNMWFLLISFVGACRYNLNVFNLYKSAAKRQSTPGGLDKYTTPNTKLNTLEMSPLPKKK